MRLRVSSRSPACFAAISVSFGLATLLATVVAAATEPVPVPARAPLPDPVLIDLGLHLGGVYRMGDAPAFPITGRTGAVFGVSAYAEPFLFTRSPITGAPECPSGTCRSAS